MQEVSGSIPLGSTITKRPAKAGLFCCWRYRRADGGFGVGSCRSSPFGGGGPCEAWWRGTRGVPVLRSEEHTSELQSLMRTSYAVFCLQKTKTHPERH